jgi:hypothetical protein
MSQLKSGLSFTKSKLNFIIALACQEAMAIRCLSMGMNLRKQKTFCLTKMTRTFKQFKGIKITEWKIT